MYIVQTKDYRYFYPEQGQPAIEIEDFAIQKGSFSLLAGASGCGKTTLLRQIFGDKERAGKETGTLICHAARKGYVWQNPEHQIVADRVEYEIVFGLENLGMAKDEMSRRLAEMVTFFGMEELLEKDTMTLSGGEMQTLNIASAVAMNPEILLLDEPASQLDPVAARKLFELLHQINEELGITILVAEQRLEDLILYVDTMFYMEKGKIKAQGKPYEVYEEGRKMDFFQSIQSLFPVYFRLFEGEKSISNRPFTKKEARLWFCENYKERKQFRQEEQSKSFGEAIVCKNLFFRYEKKEPDVIQECSLSIPKGAITFIAGGNGSGKSTFLRLLSGVLHPYLGKIKNMPKICGFLPQQPEYLFLRETVQEEIGDREKVRALVSAFCLTGHEEQNPHDLSGGEKERLALSLVLGEEKEIYLLDEPTRGLDASSKQILQKILFEYKREGKTFVIVSHDMEFMAETADYAALMFQGRTEVMSEARDFFVENQFYTTSINRIARDVSKNIITIKDVERYAEKNRN